jgi:hypothetical protein
MLGALRKTPGRTPGQIHLEYYISKDAMRILHPGARAFCTSNAFRIPASISDKDRKIGSEDVEMELQGLLDLVQEDINILKNQGIHPLLIPACVNEATATRFRYTDKHEEVHAKMWHITRESDPHGPAIESEKFLFIALTKALRLKDPQRTLSKWAYIAAKNHWSSSRNMSYLEESLARIQQIITAIGKIESGSGKGLAKEFIREMQEKNPDLLPAARKIRLRFGSVFRMLDWAQRNVTGNIVIAHAPAFLTVSGANADEKSMLQFVGDGK